MYLPVVSLNRSQQVRIGQGSPDELGYNDQLGTPDLFHALHVDLNMPFVRRDLQRHSAIGSYAIVGAVTSKWADLFASASALVTAGTGATVNVAAFNLSSRLFTDQPSVAVAAVNGLSTPSLSTGDVIYTVQVSHTGDFEVVGGTPSIGEPVYEVDSVALTGTPTAGTFTLSFVYNGYLYTTAGIAYNAAAAAVASAVLAATGGPALPAGGVVGSGGALPGAAVTLTAAGALEGAISGQSINTAGLTGGTGGSFTQTTAGTGAQPALFDGTTLPLAYVFVEQGASAPTSVTNIAMTA